jgi:peptide/nickel transport system permease protein
MQRYLIKRIIQAIITIFLMSIIVFLLGRLSGDPVPLLLGDLATKEDVELVTRELGLDKPIPVQYAIFLKKALQGDLGRSIRGARRPVVDQIVERIPASFQLAVAAMLLSIIIGIPIGVISAVRRGSFLDTAGRVLAMLGQSMPAFWVGIVLMYVISVQFRLLPTSGYGSFKQIILPAVALSGISLAGIVRLTRSSMLDVLSGEYVKLARIKGLDERLVIWKHAFSNSLIPVLTFLGTLLTGLMTGVVVIETIFAWPGLGRLAWEAVSTRDFPMIQAVVLFITFMFVTANLVVDILYAYVDPRIRYT